MKYLYGIFILDSTVQKWCMSTNRKRALAFGKANRGLVTRMLYPRDTNSWDAPTFRACSDVIADYIYPQSTGPHPKHFKN